MRGPPRDSCPVGFAPHYSLLFSSYIANSPTLSSCNNRYVADINDRYDGIESILLWPTYPNIGADDRNQYDMHYSFDMQQLKDLVSDFHNKGIKVQWPYNPWDQGTRNTGKVSGKRRAMIIVAETPHSLLAIIIVGLLVMSSS